jgi:hypothetical protein
MTYREAVEKMAARDDLGYRSVDFDTRFHTTGNTVRVCQLYTEKPRVIAIEADSWEMAFALLEAEIAKRSEQNSANEDQAPQGEASHGTP